MEKQYKNKILFFYLYNNILYTTSIKDAVVNDYMNNSLIRVSILEEYSNCNSRLPRPVESLDNDEENKRKKEVREVRR